MSLQPPGRASIVVWSRDQAPVVCRRWSQHQRRSVTWHWVPYQARRDRSSSHPRLNAPANHRLEPDDRIIGFDARSVRRPSGKRRSGLDQRVPAQRRRREHELSRAAGETESWITADVLRIQIRRIRRSCVRAEGLLPGNVEAAAGERSVPLRGRSWWHDADDCGLSGLLRRLRASCRRQTAVRSHTFLRQSIGRQ